MLGACNTCVRLQSRATSSGATVNSWMNFLFIWIFIYLFFNFIFMYLFSYLFIYFVLSLLVFFLLVFFLWLLNLFLFVIDLFLLLLLLWAFKFVIFFWHAGFISLWVGLGLIFHWSENKIFYLGAGYKFLRVGMELAVKNQLLFCILNIYIYIFWLIYCNFSIFIYFFIYLFID